MQRMTGICDSCVVPTLCLNGRQSTFAQRETGLRMSTNSIASFGHDACAANTSATGSRGAGVARPCGKCGAARQIGPQADATMKTVAAVIERQLPRIGIFVLLRFKEPILESAEEAGQKKEAKSRWIGRRRNPRPDDVPDMGVRYVIRDPDRGWFADWGNGNVGASTLAGAPRATTLACSGSFGTFRPPSMYWPSFTSSAAPQGPASRKF